jgi:DNA-binding SARP family transcriptional activator
MMIKENETAPQNGLQHSRLWRLIEAGQYDQIAEFLKEKLLTDPHLNSQALFDTLAAAQLTCWACRQCQLEIERYQQAAKEAVNRREELSRQLYAMLVYIGGDALAGMNEAQPVTKTVAEPKRAAASLSVYCLGSFQVYQNDQPITEWSSLKARSIFKYLIVHSGKPVAKDILMDVFWPDSDLEAARRNLHQAIYSLRQTLKQGCPDCQPVPFENDCYLLNPELNLWIDYIEFEKHAKAGRQFELAGDLAEAIQEYSRAEALYQGDFLKEDLYEDWPNAQRTYLQSLYLDLVERLSRSYVQQGKYVAAIKLCQKILNRDACHEEIQRRLIECYLAQGQRSLAIRQYQSCVKALKSELDVAPSPETQVLYQQIVDGTRTKVLAGLEGATL